MNAQYQVVRFSPDPEVVEPINVAILVSNGVHRLHFDEKFPKLACVAPGFDKQLLTTYLAHLRERLESSKQEGGQIIRSTSSQFSVTEPREIRSDPAEVIPILMTRFLERSSATIERATRSKYIQTRIEDLLVKQLKLNFPTGSLLRAASPRDYLGSDVLNRLHAKDFKITRVISAERQLVAIDAIDVDAPSSVLEARSSKIGYGFYQLGKISRDLRSFEKRQLYRAAIILGDRSRETDAHVEFALQSLGKETEAVFPLAHPAPAFVEIAKAASKSLVA